MESHARDQLRPSRSRQIKLLEASQSHQGHGTAHAIVRFRDGILLFFAFSWWAILLRIVAIVHFIRRRPNFFWIWVILFSWIGALVYIVVEVIPDAGLLRSSFQVFPRRRRIQELERIVLDNPSAGNYEELGLLYLDDGNFARARACYRQGDFFADRLGRSVLPSRRRRGRTGRLCRRRARPGARRHFRP